MHRSLTLDNIFNIADFRRQKPREMVGSTVHVGTGIGSFSPVNFRVVSVPMVYTISMETDGGHDVCISILRKNILQ